LNGFSNDLGAEHYRITASSFLDIHFIWYRVGAMLLFLPSKPSTPASETWPLHEGSEISPCAGRKERYMARYSDNKGDMYGKWYIRGEKCSCTMFRPEEHYQQHATTLWKITRNCKGMY
jgi:hypothetical protein